MHYLVALILILASLFSTVAMADDAEGKIMSINKDSETLSLDDGKTYKLPGEFDYSAINKGMKVIMGLIPRWSEEMVVCVDSDFVYLFGGRTPQSKEFAEAKFMFHS